MLHFRFTKWWIWCMFVRASWYKRREENQLDTTECFFALIICSTCFGHSYARHQELETILVLLPHLVCNALVQLQSHNFPHPGRIACCSAPNSRPAATKALHTICGNNTSIVSSSWWWAYKCPKHVEQVISAIKYSVASSWFSSLRLQNGIYDDVKFEVILVASGLAFWDPVIYNVRR